METPRKAWPLWIAGVALGLVVVPLVMYHGHLYYAEGGRSPDGPAMFLMSVIVMMPVWFGAWLVLIAIYLFRYPGRVSLARFRSAGFLTPLLAIAAMLLSSFFVWLAVARINFWMPSRLPFVAHFIGCAIYLQFLRAAATGRSRR